MTIDIGAKDKLVVGGGEVVVFALPVPFLDLANGSLNDEAEGRRWGSDFGVDQPGLT